MLEGWTKANKITWAATLFIVVLLCAALLTGCGHQNVLHSGKVIDKSYDDPDDWYVAGYTTPGHEECSTFGKTTSCSYYPGVYVPGYWEHDDAHWYLKITGTTKDGKVVTETHEVDQYEYSRVHVGVLWEE